MGTLISEEYKKLLQITHAQSPGWGTTAHKFDAQIRQILRPTDRAILDYGCGKGSLKGLLTGHHVTEYDPGIPGKDIRPCGPFDLVMCIDVLEHVEPGYAGKVIVDLLDLAFEDRVFAIIDTVPAKKILPDGRNAHLTLRKPAAWFSTFSSMTNVLEYWFDGRRLGILCGRA